MRPVLPAIAAAALLLAGLTACSGASSTADGTASTKGCPAAKPGDYSKKVTVTGASKSEPKVKVDGKLAATTTERAVVTGGKGDAVKDGSAITWSYALYNGTSGKKIGALGYGSSAPQSFTVSTDQNIPGLAKALTCTTVGSRIVAVIPPKDAFGSTGQSQLGIGAKDDLVVVADVRSLVPTKANGTTQKAPEGFPTVKLAASGKPTVTIPDTDPPSETKVGLLKKGSGATVKEGDTVTVQYQGIVWQTKKIFDQSWGRGPTSFATTGVVAGFAKAIVGQKVGSQTIVVMTPADGYGSTGNSDAGITGTDNLVFVVDILATTAATSG